MSKSKLSLICLAILLALPSMAFAQKAGKAAPPVVSSIAPTSATAGGPGFALTVNGSNFSTGSIVLWNGNSISTTYVSATQLQGTIPGARIAAAGVAQVAVYTPGRSGGTSNLVAFTINAASTTTTTTGAPLAITTTSLPVGTAGTAYGQTLAASGGTAPYAWSAISGTVPPGLTLSSAGAVSGTPTTAGSYSFMAQVQDSASATSSLIYSVSIGAATTPPLAVSTVSVPGGTAGTAYSTNLAATGGTAPYTWSVAAGSTLPPGLALSGAGAISGTPDMPATYPFSVQVRDSVNNTSTMAYSLAIVAPAPPPPPTTTCNSPYGNCSDPYEGGSGPPATRTNLSACGVITPSVGQYLYLPSSIGTDPTAICITLNYSANTGWTLDLGGHTVTGAIVVNSNVSGATILNGVIACNIPDPTNCLKLVPDNRMVSQFRAHHLTMNQQYTGASQARAIYVSAVPTTAYSGGGSGAGKRVRIDHISAVMSSSPDDVNVRRSLISIIGGATYGQSFQVDHNDLTCPSNAWSCWPISFFSIGDLLVDHNVITMYPFDVHHAYGSGVAWEAGAYAGAHNAEIAYNTIMVNNHRGIRFWGCAGGFLGLSIHDNYFQQINLGNRFGAVHLGEMGSLTNFQDAAVYSNLFDIVGGNAISVSGAQGVTVYNNTATCSSGCPAGYYFVRTDVPDAASSGADVTVTNNNVQALTNAGLPAVMICGPPGNSALTCSAGVTFTSSGTSSNSGAVVGNGTIR